jgi:hypothetical protein
MATMPRERFTERVEARTVVAAVSRPVAGWGGVLAGVVVGAGLVGLLSVLGIAVGITVLPDDRAAAGNELARLGIGTAAWAVLSVLVGFFVGGLVAARTTNHPDRGGALIQGTLVWILGVLVLIAFVASGISAGVTGLFQSFGLLTRGALVSGLATATGNSTDETARALEDLRARIAPLQDDPAKLANEVQAFFDQLAERSKARESAAGAVQRQGRLTSWIVSGALLLTLLVSVGGALTGTPEADDWRLGYE